MNGHDLPNQNEETAVEIPPSDPQPTGNNPVEKRKREEDENANSPPQQRQLDPYYKTSLCSYFRRQSGSCSHGSVCKYAHGEAELRPRPDNTWDPTSERGKKARRDDDGEDGEERNKSEEKEKEIMMTDVIVDDGDGGGSLDVELSKCLVHLPRKWNQDNLRKFLTDQGISFKSAKKKKGMTVGFVTFESAEQLIMAKEDLDGKDVGNKKLKVADVIPRSYDKKIKSAMVSPQEAAQGTESVLDEGNVEVLNGANANGTTSSVKSVRDAVTPLAHLAYTDQLEQKKNSIMQMLKKLTRNARKACPSGVSLPEWILKSREIGGLPCELEGILESPLTKGYRNKCEFSVGYSIQGRPTVGFMLGNFREGVTAVEEPIDCPNVSKIACKYASIFQEFLQQSKLPLWNRFKNTGFWRQLTVREGRLPEKVIDAENPETRIAEVLLMVQVSTSGFGDDSVNGELKELANAFALGAATNSPTLPLTALVLQDHQGISNVAPSDAPLRVLPIPPAENISEVEATGNATEARIHDYISNLKFSISPTAFFQVNTLAAEKLYSLAGDWAGLGSDTLLFDICCGTGTIGLTLAHRVGLVVGIEMNASAVADAHRNAEINGIKNCRFICSKAEDVMGTLLKEYLNEHHIQDDLPNSSEKGDKDTSSDDKENSMENVEEAHEHTSDGVENVEDSSGCAKGDRQQHQDPLQDNPMQDGTISDDKKETSTENLEDAREQTSYGVENVEDSSGCAKIDGQQHQDPHQENSARDGTTSLLQFKNVVAIVDPPRGGLHPIVIKALRTHSHLRRLVYISCNPETLVANAIELCTPTPEKVQKGNKDNRGWRRMSSAGLARHRIKSMPISKPFRPVKAMAVDLFPHTTHCEMVMLLER